MTEATGGPSSDLKRRISIGLVLNASIVAIEFLIGWRVHSVGLMSDAGHNFIDQGTLFLTLWAEILAARPTDPLRTFGYHRTGIVAAFLNASALIVTAALLAMLAIERLLHPMPVKGAWVISVASFSFLANLGIALLLRRGSERNLNLRGAFLHMLGDAWVSLGVAVSGGVLLWTGWTAPDAVIGLVIVVAISAGAWPVLRDSLRILLEWSPADVDASKVADMVRGVNGVANVHDLHVWSVKPDLAFLTCHVLLQEGVDGESAQRLLTQIRGRVASEFPVHHLTIQMETVCCHPDAVYCDLWRPCTSHEAQAAKNGGRA